MNEQNIAVYWDKIIDFAVTFAPKLAGAIVVVFVGFWLVRKLSLIVRLSLEKANFSREVTPFLLSFLNIALKVVVLLAAAGIVGIETTSIVGILAAAGFAVGLALQGSLGNFAAGILVLVLRPYKVGDTVEINGRFGKVEEIHVFNTILSTPGLKTLIIPNGKVIEDTITNYSEKGAIRLELKVTMPYEESFPKVKSIILEALHQVPLLLETPAPEVGIETFDTHNIVLAVRPYILPDDYWEGIFETNKAIKAAFNRHGIKMAYSEGIELGTIGE
ncbi:MAG: mechanosensitive ion channel family protein [Lewinellaceae bacterium]|nr:mechanosensitive ion channel family protein [Saprospiraceae bacterium]MCB9337756.1 mechanosensitive ion channel family protein [Lewinellaceae bacterium]